MSKVKIKITPKGFTLRKTLPIGKVKKFNISSSGRISISGSSIVFDEFEKNIKDIEFRLAKPRSLEYFFFFLITLTLVCAVFVTQPLWILPFHFFNAKFSVYNFVRKYIRYKKMVYEHKLKALKE